jgi:hypothetical protein
MANELLERLQRDLDWPDILRQVNAHDMVWYIVSPGEEGGTSLDLLTWGDDVDGFSQVSIGDAGFHYHVDSYDEMITSLRPLVRGGRELVEELDIDAIYQGGGLRPIGALPESVSDDTALLRRRRFGQEPTVEPLPRTAYVETKLGLMLPAKRDELRKLYRQLDAPCPLD